MGIQDPVCAETGQRAVDGEKSIARQLDDVG